MESEDNKSCPIKNNALCKKFCELPLERQVLVAYGSIMFVLFLLTMFVATIFLWLIGLFAAGMVFAGFTAKCPLFCWLAKCSKGGSCGT